MRERATRSERVDPRRIDQTCRENCRLLELLPLRELGADRLTRLEQHARDCVHCRAALSLARATDLALMGLEEPAPPDDLARAVLSRLDKPRSEQESDSSRRVETRPSRNRLAAAALWLGMPIALGAETYRWLTAGPSLEPLAWRVAGSLFGASLPTPWVFVLAIGLALTLTALFASAERHDVS